LICSYATISEIEKEKDLGKVAQKDLDERFLREVD
jgi:hypothetical protein